MSPGSRPRWSDGTGGASRAKLFNCAAAVVARHCLQLPGRGTRPHAGGIAGRGFCRIPTALAFFPMFKGRDGCRTPMPWNDREVACGFTDGRPWLPIPPEHHSLSANLQETAPDSVLNAYRTFVRWRRGLPALLRGAIRLFESREGTWSSCASKTTRLFSPASTSVPRPPRFAFPCPGSSSRSPATASRRARSRATP